VQEKEITNNPEVADLSVVENGRRIIALDPGTKRIGVAVSDETQTLARPLEKLERASWKKLLESIKSIIAQYDAAAVVIGLPLETDGAESEMSGEARRIARNLGLSIDIPVFLQDERVTSYEAKSRLWEQGVDLERTRATVDSEAAVIILDDFISRLKSSRR
jgi:putative Holliday junction resolvase